MAHGPVLAPVGPQAPPHRPLRLRVDTATRTAGPLLWTTGTTTSVEANIKAGLPVHITAMNTPSAW